MKCPNCEAEMMQGPTSFPPTDEDGNLPLATEYYLCYACGREEEIYVGRNPGDGS